MKNSIFNSAVKLAKKVSNKNATNFDFIWKSVEINFPSLNEKQIGEVVEKAINEKRK